MPNHNYNQNHEKILDQLLLSNSLIRKGIMFGFPAYYVGKKLAMCVYENGIGIKVPQQTATRLIEEGKAIPFQPYGKRKMREWIQIDHNNSEEYREDVAILQESIDYIAEKVITLHN